MNRQPFRYRAGLALNRLLVWLGLLKGRQWEAAAHYDSKAGGDDA